MAMLFSEQQPKQVHKAHLQQSMCQAMELVEHTIMGALPQPGAFPGPRNPCRVVTSSLVCSPSPGEVSWTRGTRLAKPLALTFPRAERQPQPLPTEGRGAGVPHGSPRAQQLSPCASPTVPPDRAEEGGSPWPGGCWGREGPAEVSQRRLKMEGKGHFPAHPEGPSVAPGSLTAAGGCQHCPRDPQALLSTSSSIPREWEPKPGHGPGRGWARARGQQGHLKPGSSPGHCQHTEMWGALRSLHSRDPGAGGAGQSRSSSGGT